MKIGLIVEGDSDKKFFEDYFKPKLKKDIIVISSGGKKSGCKILNKAKVHKDIEALFKRKCEMVYVLIDLDTQCKVGQQFNCILELKKWYKEKIEIDKFDNTLVAIVSKEIESWMLSGWETSDNKSKEDLSNKFQHRKKLREEDLVKKFLSSKKDIQRSNNRSLKYFLEKLGL
ncbi:MAG: DUF4276 family protein [Sulfurimonas sp.]|uniref:DUF4276 family protein n=1 Tax=Sulfurimonas sp. TaxID=2022749 RepID=UPI0028CF5E7B|nr:DUF4276 family protein [Sulfurimonas sp.]MDT8337854.1 DUF4276 family protein [Sulfurimonas sp.]